MISGPRVYRTSIQHRRRAPIEHAFSYRSHTWVVDVDDLPDHGALARFEARDHLGDPQQSIRRNVEDFLAARGIDARGARILMAANARAFGYCFNPISVLWVLGRDETPVATIVEVHNTYGDRHAYLVHPDEHGRARVDKQMYVSPFHGTDGSYDLVVPPPTDQLLRIAVRLHTDDHSTFSAALTGTRVVGGVIRSAPAAAVNALRIRRQGIALWARGLPIRPRPEHRPQHRPQHRIDDPAAQSVPERTPNHPV